MKYMSQTWKERCSSGKHGKRDVNVAREMSTWQDRHYRANQSSQMWQERHICHKRGKRDVPVKNVARETLTWKERRQSGKSDINVARPMLSGNMIFFIFKFPLFCDNMDNFVHNATNKMLEFLQYVLVRYTTTKLLVNGHMISSIILMKVAREFVKPKGMTNHSKRTSFELKAVFHTSVYSIGTWW
jgi:hypothetical protein